MGYQVVGTASCLAPLQQLHWIDAGVEAEQEYRYTLWTVYGTPDKLNLRDACVLHLRTASWEHEAFSLHLNRGVVATPAYRQQFDNRPTDQQPPHQRAAAEAYLSRGLHEALLAFLAAATMGDQVTLVIYEVRHPTLVQALRDALARGVSVRLVYHAKDDVTGQANTQVVTTLQQHATGMAGTLTLYPRRRVPGLSHNKLMVHQRAGQPIAVWTGSTNFTAAGLFLQTNVGIEVRDPALVAAYAAYADILCADPPAAQARAQIAALTTPASLASRLFLSPVAGERLLQAAVDLIGSAKNVVLISCPFGLDARIVAALDRLPAHVLVYGLLNTNQAGDLQVLNRDGHIPHTFIVPAWIKTLNGAAYDASTGRGNQIHIKSLVIDPWSAQPQLLIGSANWSDESVTHNDENVLRFAGNRWAAALVATEFLRVFAHYRFRNHIRALAQGYDLSQPLQASGTLNGEPRPSADGTVWLITPDEVEDMEGGANDTPTVLGETIANLWLKENDTWVSQYDTGLYAREQTVFCPAAEAASSGDGAH